MDNQKLNRLVEECAKLDPSFEKAMAEEGVSEELTGGRNTEEVDLPGETRSSDWSGTVRRVFGQVTPNRPTA